MRPAILFPIFMAGMLPLSGCETFLGVEEAPPLPGKRISILVNEQTLKPDSTSAVEKIILPTPTPNPNWPQAGGYPNHAMHHIKIPGEIREAWSVNIGAGSDDEERLIAQPVVAGGRVYTMDAESEISAFDAKTGDDIWTTEITPDDEADGHVGGGLAYEGGKLFVTTGFAEVISLDANTGKVLWRRNLGAAFRTAPTVRGNRVFALTLSNKLFALSGSSGETLWSHSGIEEMTSFLGGASPAVESGVVIAPFSSGELVALKVENGQVLWSDSLSGNRRSISTTTLPSIRGRPVIDRGVVIAISNSGQIAAVNLRTGRRIWDRAIGGIESPWVAGDFIFFLTNDSELVAMARRTGRIHWVKPLPQWEDPEDKTGRITWTGPVLTSDRLIVAGSSGEALSISPYTGTILGKVEMPDGVTIGPVAAGDTLYFLSNDADLVAYR